MSLVPISIIIDRIQSQPGWENVRDWGLIIQAWLAIQPPTIPNRSRPKSLSRGILTVATNSSSLAHQLTFGRKSLCQQLNQQLVIPITDLRFVAVGNIPFTIPTLTDDRSMAIDAGEIVVCSHCNCRAREGELRRWGVCQFCAIDLGIIGG